MKGLTSLPEQEGLLQFVSTGGVETDSFSGLKKGQGNSQTGFPSADTGGTGRNADNPISAAAGGTQGTQTAGQPEPPASG